MLIRLVNLALRSAPFLRSSTYTNLGLDYIRENDMFGTANGGRSDAPNNVIIFTDGPSNEPALTLAAADNLRKTGVKIFSVGIGGNVDKTELTNIASTSENVFTVDDFSNLDLIEKELSERACKG